MSSFTDIFIRRPVLAIVVSLMILVLGLRAMSSMPILQYPRTQNAIVTVSTTYPGADPDVVAGFITTPLENAIAQANGIDYMTSTSTTGTSTITANLRLNYDTGKALTEINTKVNSVLNQLPTGTQQPVLTVKVGQTIDAMYIGFRSDAIAPNQVTDYLIRVVQPKLQAVEGVQTAELLGSKTFAMRAWLDPIRLAAYGVTASEVSTALTNNDYIASLGNTKGQMVQVNLTASTSLHNVDEFKNLIVKQANGAIVRLKDVANVTLGSDDYDSATMFNGNQSVYVGIQIAPSANLLDVIKGVRAALPEIERQLPSGLTMGVIYDSSDFVNSSIEEVIHTLVEALVIVTIVVFAFLGSWRSVLIPVIAIPLSLIGTFLMMLAFGFSINLLTLLALVLAIGLVVDDAIIVVESVNHHMEEGMTALQAAFASARQLANPIIAMTVVLVAVYVPIGFQGGLTGALFTEFAFTLVGAVTISAVVALTLTPMMSARMLKPVDHAGGDLESRMVLAVDRVMGAVTAAYSRSLTGALNYLPVIAVFAGLVLCSVYWLYSSAQSELAPEEDQGIILAQSISAPNATLQQKQLYNGQTFETFAKHPETETVFQVESPSTSIAGWVLKPWDQRKATTKTLQPMIQQELNQVAGQKIVAFQQSPLPGSNGLPMQIVIGTSDGFDKLNEVASKFLQDALNTGLFIFLNNDLKIDQPQASLVIDREKTSLLGLTMNGVGGALSSLLGGGYVNYFSLDGRSYKVIPQVKQEARLNTDQVLDYYIRTGDGTMVPLSTVARIETKTVPESLNHFQQVNAATIAGVVAPGVTTGDAITALQDLAKRTLPAGYTLDFGGASRQYVQESGGFVTTFAFALIVIFLALAALFNSFRDPVVILLSVPMSLAGALLFISVGIGGASINIYTQVGLTTLMGLISKHGILMLEVANELQLEGKSKRDAIIAAATLRLRPILMTTAAMVLGVVPLIFASGAGAASRYNLGLVIATGLAIGTLFTLYVVPAAYVLIGETHHKEARDEEVAAPPHAAEHGA
ncbi:putative multidrug resistance protein [Azorhizobium caulinodans ORS 571]|uniref:Putative multidrug resistance protein n=1 Tax=Azorhizobium caulinodans (strain ATCC 43989 / DSM 5975 / JCM 20966 / LMG 6465 / NBRC 14845 / NCIMB 13405 / ORS 571) TaxID=438753 RepID=A8IHJ8_AZOC5|nr:efflux RND transporter permease subunit [Azorhizobium caulinodans]BAF89284.1 putative multidrug resistance protein [Azorhizobium caulinodans ORS 571]